MSFSPTTFPIPQDSTANLRRSTSVLQHQSITVRLLASIHHGTSFSLRPSTSVRQLPPYFSLRTSSSVPQTTSPRPSASVLQPLSASVLSFGHSSSAPPHSAPVLQPLSSSLRPSASVPSASVLQPRPSASVLQLPSFSPVLLPPSFSFYPSAYVLQLPSFNPCPSVRSSTPVLQSPSLSCRPLASVLQSSSYRHSASVHVSPSFNIPTYRLLSFNFSSYSFCTSNIHTTFPPSPSVLRPSVLQHHTRYLTTLHQQKIGIKLS